ncbi:hypothetical protein FB639_005339, partial [Coemansia asiatica]
MSQHPQGYDHQQQTNMDAGHTNDNYNGPFVHGYGNANNRNRSYDKFSHSVPNIQHTSYGGQHGEQRDGRPNEQFDHEKQQHDYLGNPLNRPPGYYDANHSHAQTSWVDESTRGLKDFFYKPPPETYSGTYGADYKPEISKRKVGAAVAAAGLLVGAMAYKNYRKQKKRREQEMYYYPREDDEYYGYNHRGVNHSYEHPGYGSMHRNP